MYDDEEMQGHFETHFYRRPIARGRRFYLENSISLSDVHNIFEFQGLGDFLRIFEDIYTGVVLAFYSTLDATNKDNTSPRSIVRNFKLQVLPSDIAKITNTPNDGIQCHDGERWWEELCVIDADVAKTFTRNRGKRVRDIQTSRLLTPIRAIFSVVQHTVAKEWQHRCDE